MARGGNLYRNVEGGCHLSVKAALPSWRPGVLGQLASELASVTVEEWTLNNRARSAALPPGRMAAWLAGVTRRCQATIHYFYLRKGGDWVKGQSTFQRSLLHANSGSTSKGSKNLLAEIYGLLTRQRKRGGKNPHSCLVLHRRAVCTHMHINTQPHAVFK